MKIEVNYNELYNLGDYMEKMFEELKKDFDEINIISESLNLVLQGFAEQTISTRMKNFNTTQFSQIVNYTHLLGSEVTNCAKAYNAEDDEFAQKMKQEASKYGVEDGTVISDTRYQTQTTSSGYVSATPTTSATTGTTSVSTTNNENTNSESVTTENISNVSEISNSQNNTFEDMVIEDVETDGLNTQNINVQNQAGQNINSSQTNIDTNVTNETVSQVNNTQTSKSKGLFGGLFGAAAAAMGFKVASNKKDEKENNTVK